jgi:hypothetical protein
VAERAHDLGAVEESRTFLGRRAVLDVRVVEDLGERAAALVLPNHVLGDPILTRRTGGQKRERIAQEVPEGHGGDSRYGAAEVLIGPVGA